MKIYKVIDASCSSFSIGERVARCYVQKCTFLGVMYYSLSSGVQQVMFPEEIE